MIKFWRAFFYWLVKGVLRLRYRIEVKGLDSLKAQKGGFLFLPNHPAEIDPVILISVLWKKFPVHPLVIENFYYMKWMHFIFKLVGAVPIPDINGTVNKWKERKITKAFVHIGEKLREGEHFLIYPSGRLKHEAEEVVGGASLVHNLLQGSPKTKVALVRTTGLWGSRFSRGLTGVTPDFGKMLWEGLKIILKNGIFFVPKRDVVIEIELAPSDFPIQSPRPQFNQYLEQWYNRPKPEPLKRVSELFWKESLPPINIQKAEENPQQTGSVSPAVEKEIFEKIGQLARRSDIQKTQDLERDLGLDSLDRAQLYTFLEGRYELADLPPEKILTVGDVLKAASVKNSPAKQALPKSSATWPAESHRPPVLPPCGATLQEAFLNTCSRMGSHIACADAILGPVSYRRLKTIVLILSRRLRKIEERHIGILLPSSTMTYALIFAVLLANKVPVMLNWTLGPRALDHCRKTAGLKTILSSRRFLDNLNNADVGDIDDSLFLLEDLRASLTLWDKLRGMWGIKPETISENDPAVILFTSGTEALPKGVPLTHRNLLSNHRAALECVSTTPQDVFYGVLPPFHSFGFSVTGILPLLAGMKAYYAPDPTHYHAMAQDIEQWQATFFCSAPTFILGVCHVAAKDQLKSLRYVVAGAEKTPQELFEFMKTQGKEILEGYGITECAPVVTLTRPGLPRQGVGQPLPGIELCIIDSETHEPLPLGKEGEICIQGPNVFLGYLGTEKNPFLDLKGHHWYLSGDRGYLASDGSLILSGRLKRFVKIGGEMISLGGLEEELLKLAHEKKWIPENHDKNPPLAVAAAEKESEKPLIILFATFNIKKEEINQALHESGYGRLIKIAEVRQVEQIPVTGTGKVQFSALDELL